MKKKVGVLFLVATMVFGMMGCSTGHTADKSTKEEVLRMTPEDTMNYMNEIIEATNAENKYTPTEKLDMKYDEYFTNGHTEYSFHYNTDVDGNVSEIYVSFLGTPKIYKSGMNSLEGFFAYASLLACVFAIDEAEAIWVDAEDFFSSGAESGSIQASNGVTFEWSNLSSQNYWLSAKAILP